MVGVERPGANTQSPTLKNDGSKTEAVSSLQSLLEYPDGEVRRAAAAALKELEAR